MTTPPSPNARATGLIATCLAGLLAACGPVGAQTRPFTANDMLDVVQISGGVSASAAGDRLAFVLPDLTDDWNVLERRQVGTVHVLDLVADAAGLRSGAAAVPRPIGGTTDRTSFPVFSPDGTRLALFVESARGGRLALWHLDEARLELIGAAFEGKADSAPQWATDRQVVYARPAVAPPEVEQARVSVLGISDPLPGDAYFARDPRAGLRVVDTETGTEATLVPEGSALRAFDVSPDGRWATGRVADRGRAMLWDLDAMRADDGGAGGAGGSEVGGASVTEIGGAGERPEWLPDSRLLVRRSGAFVALDPATPTARGEVLLQVEEPLVGLEAAPGGRYFSALQADPSIRDPEIEPPQPGMYTIARPFLDVVVLSAGSDRLTNVTADISDQIGSVTWSPDGSALYFVAIDNATYDETLYRYDPSTERRTVIDAGPKSFSSLMPISDRLIVSVQSATAPGDLWMYRPAAASPERVTELNPQLSSFAFSRPELFHFDNQEGDRLGALLFRATGPTAGVDEPVITYVYEKLTPSIHRFQPRQQIFATHGYAVVMPNVMIKVGEPGTSYVRSAVPATEAVHAMGFTNGRACMWGGSFGAYATSYVITQTTMFDCAVSRATPPELFRNWASGRDRDSDNIERGQARMGGSPFEVQGRYLSQSAFFHLDKVETPVLITHGVKDYTILYEEGAMMFYALRRLGKEAVLVTYRDGDHSLYRHSRADALDVHQRMLDWFAKYLRGEGAGRSPFS